MGEEYELTVRAATVREAFRRISEARPHLRAQLFDEQGALREHVLCLHNGANTKWPGRIDAPLEEGDTLDFLQAVSGG